MKKRFLFTAFLFALVLAHTAAEPEVQKRQINTNIPGLECLEEKTTTSKDDWLKDNVVLKFRTTNGKSCDIAFDLANSSFSNCKPVYKSCFVSGNDSDWSMGFIDIQANDHGPWSYRYTYTVKWRN